MAARVCRPPAVAVEIGEAVMADVVFSALIRAWATTVIATTMLVAAVALAQIWSSAIYLRALQRALLNM
jgi:hypothetical protein